MFTGYTKCRFEIEKQTFEKVILVLWLFCYSGIVCVASYTLTNSVTNLVDFIVNHFLYI